MERHTRISAAFAIGLAMAIAVLVSACSSRQPTEQPSANAKPNTPQGFAQWYQDCWGDFNAKNWDAFKKCYAPNAASQQPGYGRLSVTGPDAIVKASQDFMKTFPDGRGEGQLILVNGNHITSIYLLKGTNTGPLFGPDGKELPGRNQRIGLFFGHSIEVDSDGQVVKEIGAMDGITLENQMGLLKMAGRPLAQTGVPIPVVVIAKNDETEMQNVETETSHLAAWNKHDKAAVDSYESGDYVLHDLTEPNDRNKMQADEMNKAYWAAFPDATINSTSLWGAGNYVSVIGALEGTNDGDFAPMKLKKTGKKIVLPFVDIFRLEGGKVKEEWLFFDSASLVTQLRTK
jgi:predicted ester cyclase